MKKRVSAKQLAANRMNARKSTGPRSAAGKAVSRMNATRHGILSEQVVASGFMIKESAREFRALHKRFYEDLDPVGPMEEMLVDQIVTTQWRLRRVLRAEKGEVALSVDADYRKRNQRDPVMQWLLWGASLDPAGSMSESAMGNAMLARRLEEARAVVERDGVLSGEAIQCVMVGNKPNTISKRLEDLLSWFANNPENLEPADLRVRHLEQVSKFFDSELNHLKIKEEECDEWEWYEKEARLDACALPPIEVLDKIARYETRLLRQLARAMAQLERLQRMRSGEAVPPPLSVNFSERE